MKKVLIAVTLVLCQCVAFAQNEHTQVADSPKAVVGRYHKHNPIWHLVHFKFGKQRKMEVAEATIPSDMQIGPNSVTVRHIRDGKIISEYTSHNLKTTWGIDQVASFLSNDGGAGAIAFSWINLSTDTGSPAAGDCVNSPCTLAGLISSGGLAPSNASYAHTTGTATYTLTHTWTATTTFTGVQKAAIAAQALGGGCTGVCGYMFENTFAPVALNINDQLQIVWTITIS